MNDVTELVEVTYGLDRQTIPQGRWRRRLRKAIHFFSYHLILKRRTTRVTRAAGFRLVVRPTVFHPRRFITSEFFASFIGRLDLSGKRVADVGTGSGILALAADHLEPAVLPGRAARYRRPRVACRSELPRHRSTI